jgi:hypothetical protein
MTNVEVDAGPIASEPLTPEEMKKHSQVLYFQIRHQLASATELTEMAIAEVRRAEDILMRFAQKMGF